LRVIKPAGIFLSAAVIGIALNVGYSKSVEEAPNKSLPYILNSASREELDQRNYDLITALREGDADDRQRAAIAMGTSGDAQFVEPLAEALNNDEDDFVRSFAATSLGNIGDPKAVDPLIKALSDRHLLVRRSAAKALGSLGDQRAFDPLIRALNNEHYMVRRAAALALGSLADARAVKPLIGILRDEDIYIRIGAAIALMDIGESAIPPLVNVLSDWTIGPRVVEILEDLHWQPSSDRERVWFEVATRNKKSLLEDWETTRRVLVDDANSEDRHKVQNAVFALIGIGQDEVVDALVSLLGKKGNLEIASAFLDCGNNYLHQAARKWLEKQNCALEQRHGIPKVEWGQMKSS
jgi:HEAT repeat protein